MMWNNCICNIVDQFFLFFPMCILIWKVSDSFGSQIFQGRGLEFSKSAYECRSDGAFFLFDNIHDIIHNILRNWFKEVLPCCFTSFLVVIFRDLDLAELHGWENSLPRSGEGEKGREGEKGLTYVSDWLTGPASDEPFSRFSHPGPTPSAESKLHPSRKAHCPLMQPKTQHDHVCTSQTSL